MKTAFLPLLTLMTILTFPVFILGGISYVWDIATSLTKPKGMEFGAEGLARGMMCCSMLPFALTVGLWCLYARIDSRY